MINKLGMGLVTAAILGMAATLATAGTLDDVKKRGQLICGVNGELPGFGFVDKRGRYQGFDVDFCNAVAAAIGVKVSFRPLTAKERFPALQSGEIDMLARNTTWTMSRDGKLGLDFVTTTYYDGQGFMVRKSLGIKSARELGGASVCITAGTTTELNLADYFRSTGMNYKPVTYERTEDTRKAYEAGRCDAMTSDASQLAALRTGSSNPNDHMILPEIISKEPLGPLVRHGDNKWGDLVRWVVNAIITAEEKGITKANVGSMVGSSRDPEVQRMLGVTGDMGGHIGLSKNWAVRVIKAVGNYGEIFERNIGPNTALGLKRGLNAQWSNGGILYSPPIR